MDDIPEDPLLCYIITRMIEEDSEKAVKIFMEAAHMLKEALKRCDHLERKHKDFER